jgi:HSP20 family protein
MWAPAVDIWEDKESLVLAFEIPGIRDKDVQLSITDDLLSLRGERGFNRELKDESYHRLERVYGKFERNVRLPMPVQSDKAKAVDRDGVLEITLPKAEAVKCGTSKSTFCKAERWRWRRRCLRRQCPSV